MREVLVRNIRIIARYGTKFITGSTNTMAVTAKNFDRWLASPEGFAGVERGDFTENFDIKHSNVWCSFAFDNPSNPAEWKLTFTPIMAYPALEAIRFGRVLTGQGEKLFFELRFLNFVSCKRRKPCSTLDLGKLHSKNRTWVIGLWSLTFWHFSALVRVICMASVSLRTTIFDLLRGKVCWSLFALILWQRWVKQQWNSMRSWQIK